MANNLKQLDANQVLRSAYDPVTNRLRTDATVETTIGTVEVIIDHENDSIKLGDGTDLFTSTTVGSDIGLDVNIINSELTVNATDFDIRNLSSSQDNVAIRDSAGDELDVNSDGSIDVNVNPTNPVVDVINTYNEISSVASSTATTVTSYTVGVGKTGILQSVHVSGTNIATYEIKVNGSNIETTRTFFGNSLDSNINFTGEVNSGYSLSSGDVVTVVVTHNRPSSGDFNARIQAIEI